MIRDDVDEFGRHHLLTKFGRVGLRVVNKTWSNK
jgi:hypothetical protein